MASELNLPAVIRDIRTGLDDDERSLSLDAIAQRAGASKFRLHREFQRIVGETPKRYELRLRLERAAVRLVTADDAVLDIALAGGFESHEVFTRAFRRHFGTTPIAYRASALANRSDAERVRHSVVATNSGPCIRLVHRHIESAPRRSAMSDLKIERRVLTPQPVLFVRQRVARTEISTAIGNCLGQVFPFCMKNGLALSGPPFTRYPVASLGLFTIESGMPLATPGQGEGEVQSGTLPGGPAACATHVGPYEKLGETYAAMEQWIETNGLRVAGAPWESYVTDPADYPDTKDWRTDVFWPLAED